MKIIKSFSDPKFFRRQFYLDEVEGEWFWGLSDDGELYCRCTGWYDHEKWHLYETLKLGISLDDMIRIIKQFNHLLVWL